MGKPNFWREYATQKALHAKIKSIVDSQPDKEPFESDLISDLIMEKHYFCSKRGIRPSRFRKIPKGSKYSFEGDFSSCDNIHPPISWHGVSWDKCTKPPQSDWKRIVRAMRDRIKTDKQKYRDEHPFCEDCHIGESKEVHHLKPSFNEIAEEVRRHLDSNDIADCLGDWNWFHKKDFALPENHKITIIFDEIHGKAQLQALCIDCHNKTKSAKQPSP